MKYEFNLSLETPQELTAEQLGEYMRFVRDGIMGFYRPTPAFLPGATSNLNAVGTAASVIDTFNGRNEP